MENSDQEFEEHSQQPQQNQGAYKRTSRKSPPYALFNLLVIVTAIIYGVYYQMYVKDAPENLEATGEEQNEDDLHKIPMFTAEELKKYNGEGECNFLFFLNAQSERD